MANNGEPATPLKVSADPVVLAALMEYSQLKAEQLRRMGDRDHFLYAMLLAVGAVAAVTVEDVSRWPSLYGIPFASFVLGSLYAANDIRVTELSNYLRRDLSQRFAIAVGSDVGGVFLWEDRRLRDPARAERKAAERRMLWVAFLLPSLLAAIGVLILADLSLPLRLLSVVPFLIPLWPVERWLRKPEEEVPGGLLRPLD